MEITYTIPESVVEAAEQHARDVERFLAGDLPEELFKARRVPRGIYKQRQEGLYMVRVRIAGGFLWPSQAHRLAELSRRYANGKIHVTTRQDMQFHDVKIENTYPIMKSLLEVGLTPHGGGGNTVRNVTACSQGGITPKEVFNTQLYALAVTNYLLPFESSYNLPRKFKIGFSGCPDDCSLARVNDLGFVARIHEGRRGFAVYVGGGMGTHSRVGDLFTDFLPAEDTLRLVEAVKRLFDRHGDRRNRHRARLRFAVERLGVECFQRELREELRRVTEEGVPDLFPVEINPEPRRPAASPNGFVEARGFDVWCQAAVLPQKQEGYFMARILLKRGDLPADDLDRLAEVSKQHAGSQLRTDRLQNLLLPYIPEAHLRSVYEELGKLSIDVLGGEGEHWMVSCKGSATCSLGICRAQDLNTAISQAAMEVGVSPDVFSELGIHTSGCPNNCGQHSIAPLGFFGGARRKNGRSYPVYNVVVGGQVAKDGTRLSKSVVQLPARNVPGFTAELLKHYMQSEVRPRGFLTYWEREGKDLARELAAKYSDLPLYDAAPEFYRDWGAEKDFSLAGLGPGECGAGVFELIADELKKAERAFADAERAPADSDERGRHLLKAIATAAGALLVTRGIEPGDPDVAFKGFEIKFIDENIAVERHRDLLILGRSALRDNGRSLAGQLAAARDFLDEVQRLYDSMDASFNFPMEKQARSPAAHPDKTEKIGREGSDVTEGVAGQALAVERATNEQAAVELDLRGVVCPFNFVRAKLVLEQMQTGEILEIILDDGEPIRNVPNSFREQGEEVMSVTPETDSTFRVRIRRVS